MIYVDTAVLDVAEWLCRKFQVLTGRTNVWLALQLTNLSIIVYFVWAGMYFLTATVAARIAIALFCGGLLYTLTQTVFKVPIEAYENSAYRRVSKGLRNPRRLRDAMLRISFLTLSIVLLYPVLFIYINLHLHIALLSYSLIALTTIVLYLLACDPLPPCPGKVREWLRGFAPARLAGSEPGSGREARIAVASILVLVLTASMAAAETRSWNPRAAAAHLDTRMEWWLGWPNAARDHNTACVSCHTALPYALARPALRKALGESDLSAPERTMIAHVLTRVRQWNEVEPFYPDQTRGLPKSSESRGTEAVLNALILSTRDASTGSLTDDTRQAFRNMWPLQFKTGDLKGAWAWLNFRYEPWEAVGSPYFGAALAAVAVGSAPDGYASNPDIQEQLKSLREYLQQRIESESLFNRIMALWASAKLGGILSDEQGRGIVDAVIATQRDDGGWSTAGLGSWKRIDGTALDAASDGYATGLITLVLQQVQPAGTEAHTTKGLSWLSSHQDPTSGGWYAASLNKQRDAASDASKFMSDAATAFAALALTNAEARQKSSRLAP